MPLATYTGILSCVKSTVPFGTASALTHCSSTTPCRDPYTLGQLIRFWESTRLRRDDALAFLLFRYTDHDRKSVASVSGLSPGHLRRTITRPVSYYALFK